MMRMTSKQERFAQLVASGKSQAEAYRKAYPVSQRWASSAVHTQASILAAHSKVLERIAELQRPGLEAVQLTVEGVLRELHSVVHSDLRKAFDTKTGALLPPRLWPDELARAMCSVKVVEMAKQKGPDGQPMYVKEVKVWDKNSAIEKAMKRLGLLVDRVERGDPGAFSETAEELRARIKERSVKLGLAKVAPKGK